MILTYETEEELFNEVVVHRANGDLLLFNLNANSS